MERMVEINVGRVGPLRIRLEVDDGGKFLDQLATVKDLTTWNTFALARSLGVKLPPERVQNMRRFGSMVRRIANRRAVPQSVYEGIAIQ